MIYWPGTDIIKSLANDFTLSDRMEHSCMWSKGEEKRAKELAERVAKISIKEREKQTTAFVRYNLPGVKLSKKTRIDLGLQKREKHGSTRES